MADQIRYFGETDVGLKRKNNEDAFMLLPDLGLCVVADGMGGAAAGEVASAIFVETTREVFLDSEDKKADNAEMIERAFELANKRIIADAQIHPEREGMGCTAEIVVFFGNTFVLGHLGDSRTYRYRDNKLTQLSSDHSYVQDQIDRGFITPGEARTHPMRNIILQAVGVNEKVTVDIIQGKTHLGDQYLLCSDGLTDMVEDKAIAEVLSDDRNLETKGKRLVALAKSAGGVDNITVALAEIV